MSSAISFREEKKTDDSGLSEQEESMDWLSRTYDYARKREAVSNTVCTITKDGDMAC